MSENRAYKLNAQRQPGSKRGTFMYYYYDADGHLTCDELNSKLFDKLVEMDDKYYNLERRTKYHDSAHTKLSPHNHVFRPQKPEDLPDKKMDAHLSTYEEQADLQGMITQFHGDNRVIFRMYYLERKKQEVIAKFLGKTQSYVSKRLAKIKEVIELQNLKRQDQTNDEAYAEQQWEKYLDKYRTDDDEDILFDMFRCICGSDLQEALLEWFYSYREYSKFCLQYLILRPFDKAKDGEFEERLTKLPEWQQVTYRLQFAEHMEEMQWLFLAVCEKKNTQRARLKTPPSHPDEDKVQREAEKIARRLGMTAEQYTEDRFLPRLYERLEKRYEDYRRKYKNVVVIEEDDPRPIREQIISIFGEGLEPVFRNPEFDGKDDKKNS